MEWQDVCNDPQLRNLPYKIELTGAGKIVMSPAKTLHSALQWAIQQLIYQQLSGTGRILPECPVQTRDNVKVADVAWLSEERFARVRDESACSVAPEICVEIMSASNTEGEMRDKRALYLEAGASEVWICGEDGALRFFDQAGERQTSALIPNLPGQIRV